MVWRGEEVLDVDEWRVRQLGVGRFFYSALFLSEGRGLGLAKRWAEYLTIVTTACLMPVELYEIYVHASWPRVVVLLVNTAVVAYLILELRRKKKHKEG